MPQLSLRQPPPDCDAKYRSLHGKPTLFKHRDCHDIFRSERQRRRSVASLAADFDRLGCGVVSFGSRRADLFRLTASALEMSCQPSERKYRHGRVPLPLTMEMKPSNAACLMPWAAALWGRRIRVAISDCDSIAMLRRRAAASII